MIFIDSARDQPDYSGVSVEEGQSLKASWRNAMRWVATVFFGALLSITSMSPVVAASDLEEEGRAWWSHVEKLGADDMEGRFTGSAGYQRAADYVADRFESYGLAPAGEKGFFQPVGLIAQRVLAQASNVTLVSGTQSQTLRIGQD